MKVNRSLADIVSRNTIRAYRRPHGESRFDYSATCLGRTATSSNCPLKAIHGAIRKAIRLGPNWHKVSKRKSGAKLIEDRDALAYLQALPVFGDPRRTSIDREIYFHGRQEMRLEELIDRECDCYEETSDGH